MSWEDLPYDIWELIFHHLHYQQHLRSLSLVSKHLLNLTNMACTALTFPSRESTTPDCYNATHRALFQRFPNLKSVHIYDACPGSIDNLVRQLAFSDLQLESIYLGFQCPLPRKPILLLSRNKQVTLKSLALVRLRNLNQKDVFFIAKHFPYLRHLQISYEGVTGEADEGIRVLSSKLTSLVSLSLKVSILSDQSLLYLSSNCPLITEFNVSFSINDDIDLSCFSSFQSLTSLQLEGVHITSYGLNHLSQAHLKLAKLSLVSNRSEEIDGLAMRRFLKSCRYLRHLVLRNYKFSPDMTNIAAFIPESAQIIYIIKCENVPNNTLFELTRNCPDLEELELTPAYLRMPWKFNVHINHRLRKLWLQCESLSDEILMYICSLCPNLDSCYHYGNCEVLKGGLEAIIRAKCCKIDRLGEERQEDIRRKIVPSFALYNSILGPPRYVNWIKERPKDFFFTREI